MRIGFTICGTLSLLCLGLASCATANPNEPETLSLTRPDGAAAVCTRPPAAWLDSPGGVEVAGALPNLIEALVSAPGTANGTVSGAAAQQQGAAKRGSPDGGPPGGAPPGAGSAKRATPQDGDLLDKVIRSAPSPHALDVLDYRLCLAYGKGVLSRDTYVYWLLDLRPRAFKAVPPEGQGF